MDVVDKVDGSNWYCDCSTDIKDASDCFCYDAFLDDFSYAVKKLIEKNNSYWWKITGFKLWDGERSGYFYADNPIDFLDAITVNSEWIMSATFYDDCLKYSLSHHDCPMGSSTLVEIPSELEIENLR